MTFHDYAYLFTIFTLLIITVPNNKQHYGETFRPGILNATHVFDMPFVCGLQHLTWTHQTTWHLCRAPFRSCCWRLYGTVDSSLSWDTSTKPKHSHPWLTTWLYPKPIGTYFIVFRTRRMSPYERMILPDFQGERNISAFRKKWIGFKWLNWNSAIWECHLHEIQPAARWSHLRLVSSFDLSISQTATKHEDTLNMASAWRPHQ